MYVHVCRQRRSKLVKDLYLTPHDTNIIVIEPPNEVHVNSFTFTKF